MAFEVPESIVCRLVHDSGDVSASLGSIFAVYWPAYRRWIRRGGVTPLADCADALRRSMPELVPTWEALTEAFGGDPEVARFLTLYAPPPVVRGCSQVVLQGDDGPVLLRSYDHHPRLFDAVVLRSDWLGRRTLAVTDCIWGALDGINDRGLAVALAFGGRRATGPGFSAALVVRYLLETCGSTAEAIEVLGRVPVYMPYTFTVVDAKGAFTTAFVGPDRPARFVTRRASANHQGEIEWPAYTRQVKSEQRLAKLESFLESTTDVPAAIDAFLKPPLWRRDYARGSGTLYFAAYRPSTGSLTMHWPGGSEAIGRSGDDERFFEIPLIEPTLK